MHKPATLATPSSASSSVSVAGGPCSAVSRPRMCAAACALHSTATHTRQACVAGAAGAAHSLHASPSPPITAEPQLPASNSVTARISQLFG